MEPHPELGSERSVVQPAFEKAIEDHPGAAAEEADIQASHAAAIEYRARIDRAARGIEWV